jgi:hypothetical protein
MANEMLNARKFMERNGNANSPTGRKWRRSALIVATAICRNFPRIPGEGTMLIRLPRDYELVSNNESCWRSLERTEVREEGKFAQRMYVCCYHVPNDPQKPPTEEHGNLLANAQRLARDIASGWLGEVVATVRQYYGDDIAHRFMKELQL